MAYQADFDVRYESDNLKAYLDKTLIGKGKTVVVGCEADIGKNKILNTLKDYAEKRGFLTLTGTCTVQKDENPVIDMLSKVAEKPLIPIRKDYITVDEIFIITNAGKLILHVSQKQGVVDEDLIGGMLSALQDFVGYSFREKDTAGGLARLDYADTTILVEHGGNIFAAAVTQTEHPQVREDLKKILGIIEEIYRDVLISWDGDSARFTGAKSIISAIVDKRYPVEVSLEEEKKQVHKNILDTIQMAVEKKPLLIILDNMQWADDDGVEMAQYIIQNTKNMRAMICLLYRPEESNPVLAEALDVLRRQRQIVDIRVEMRKRLDRYYGMDTFGPVFGVRIPKDCVDDFDEDDANSIIEKIEKTNIDELRKRMISIYMISDTDYKEMKMDEFFDLLTKTVSPGGKSEREEKFVSVDPSTVGKMIEELIMMTRRVLTQVTGKSGKQSAVFTIEGRGKYVKYRMPVTDASGKMMGKLAFIPTIRAAATRGHEVGVGVRIKKKDVKIQIKRRRMAGLIAVCMDTSGSMEEGIKVEIAKAFVKTLLVRAYEKRNMIALITYSGDEGEIVLPFTSNLEKALPYLEKIPFGGTTPLASGIKLCIEHIEYRLKSGWTNIPIMVLITDGTANTPTVPGTDIKMEIKRMCGIVKEQGIITLVADISKEGAELAHDVADWCEGTYYHHPI
ncbi:MAG: VWA domain-containing protein [Candidatus Omnitrophica bacterium]|nr:VWA domain-containing protein [Candidatus Omnitrophota bacterium]